MNTNASSVAATRGGGGGGGGSLQSRKEWRAVSDTLNLGNVTAYVVTNHPSLLLLFRRISCVVCESGRSKIVLCVVFLVERKKRGYLLHYYDGGWFLLGW